MKRQSLVLLGILLLASFLRLWKLGEVPVSMFGDELDVGYHAYSLLKTGKDYSGNFLPLHLQSLAEWRTPLYLYSSVPTVALFGITPLGVRLPAALFGILSIWAISALVRELLSKEEKRYSNGVGNIAAFLLAISPWHIQYSRAGFEVTQMLFFLILGLFLFLRSLKNNGAYLWLSTALLLLMPWAYSTAKVFTPALFAILGLSYYKELIRLPKRSIYFALGALLLLGVPFAYSTVFGGGTARFNYISVFGDPTIKPEVGTARAEDAYARGDLKVGTSPTVVDRLYHNKFTYIGNIVAGHVLQPLSTDFLFITGDPNPRHSIEGMGQFYKIEFIFLLLGLTTFIMYKDKRIKFLLLSWIVFAIIPSSITRDGGNHATRLILLLPPLIFLISVGLYTLVFSQSKRYRILLLGFVGGLYLLSFATYQHLYWGHNVYQSERWWHAGWGEAMNAVMAEEGNFEKVIISTRDEPPWIFFAAHSQFDPAVWHTGYPFKKHIVDGFGEVSFIDKYSFGSPQGNIGIYELGKVLNTDTLYLASAKEVNVNLIKEPERTPKDLRLIQGVAYPSGEPAFYLFTKHE